MSYSVIDGLVSSFHELIQSRGFRRLSVRPSVCKLLRKSLLLAGKWPDRHQTSTRRSACTKCVLNIKVKVKGHVIRALLCWHENRFFSRASGRIATKLAYDGLQVSVHPECAQGQGQRSRDTGTFVLARKSLLFAGKLLDRHQTCSRWSPGNRGPNFWFAYLVGTVIRIGTRR